MELAFELISGKALHFTPNHTFKMYIKRNDALIEESIGEDGFDYHGMLFPDTVVAATGRKTLHVYAPDLIAYQGVPSRPATVPVPLGQKNALQGLTLWLDNNAILSQGELQTYYTLRAIMNGRVVPVPLLSPITKVHWQGRGLFCIYLDSLEYSEDIVG